MELKITRREISKQLGIPITSFNVNISKGSLAFDRAAKLAKILETTEQELEKQGLRITRMVDRSYQLQELANDDTNIMSLIKAVAQSEVATCTWGDLLFFKYLQEDLKQPLTTEVIVSLMKLREILRG